MDLELQKRAPLLEALQEFRRMRIVPFDVPGHKRGKGNPELLAFLGRQCLETDVNSMKPLDNLCHPISVIKEAEYIAADAFSASACYFMVGGTTSSVQSMILTVCKEGDKIIMPRNVHRSAINALILCGAEPIYVNPQTDERLGISLGMETEDVIKVIRDNPNAAAVLVNNPTYYGVVSDLKKIIETAHMQNMKVLVDEAHGTHFYFGDDIPAPAMSLGADMASVSMHKSGGSLTQSSILLCGDTINSDYVRQIINLTQTTSASYLLLSSLDIARRNLALHGRETFRHVNELAEYARSEINKIGDYYAYSRELTVRSAIHDFDTTKLSVNTYEIGLAGIEVYDILRDAFDIQVEFGDLSNILAYISLGDREQDIERLVAALAEIRRKYKKSRANLQRYEYINPIVALTPKQAFYSVKKSVPLENCAGEICAEFVMCYPPGIPILAPGERITGDIIGYIKYAKEKGCLMTGPEDMEINNINVCGGER